METIYNYLMSLSPLACLLIGIVIVLLIIGNILFITTAFRFKRKYREEIARSEELGDIVSAQEDAVENWKNNFAQEKENNRAFLERLNKDYDNTLAKTRNDYENELHKQSSVADGTIKRLREEIAVIKDEKRVIALNIAQRQCKYIGGTPVENLPKQAKEIYNFLIGKA